MSIDFKDIARKILENGNDVIGVRSLCDDESCQPGAECRESYEWDFEHDLSTYSTTGETAGGTCATYINTDDVWFTDYDDEDINNLAKNLEDAYNKNREYGGGQTIIVGDRFNNEGVFDLDEIRIVNAKVLLTVE